MKNSILDSTNVTVVIPAYNNCPHIKKVVLAVLEQSVAPAKIIVGHSGSGDPTEELEALDSKIKVIHSEQRKFAGAARNMAIMLAETDWIGFVDDDVIPDQDWLEQHILAANGLGEGYFFGGSIDQARKGGYWGQCMWVSEFSAQHPKLPQNQVETLAGCNMFIPKKLLEAAGYFPEQARTSEDSMLQMNINELGAKLIFNPKAKVSHFNISGFRHYCKHQAPLGKGSATLRMLYSNRGSFFVRNPLACIFLPFGRFLLIFQRVFKTSLRNLFLFLYLSPGIFIGLVV